MKVVRILALSKGKLYTVEYDTEARHALQILKDEWSDIAYFYEFFKKWLPDYRQFYGSKKLTYIVEDAIDDADTLLRKLKEGEVDLDKLNRLFIPLDNHEDESTTYELQKLKAKTYSLSFLRVYGLRYGNTVVITGGAIKLTKYMRDREHTRLELYKLSLVKAYLEDTENEAEIVYLDLS
uniref:hypothetical protein n=1 Tax=Roseivirga sp. TaxID=1964215 RepID=UPI00404819ED